MTSSGKLLSRRNEMFRIAERYLESDLTRRAFCETESLVLSTFDYWLRKYKEAHDTSAKDEFIPLSLKTEVSASRRRIELDLPGDISLRIYY
jgi:hypothetical protein